MKQDEKRYSMKRVENVLHVKKGELREKYTKKKKDLTNNQKLQSIKNGTCDIHTSYGKLKNLTLKSTLEEAIDFSEIEFEEEFDQESYDKKVKLIKIEANKVCDAIMLGNTNVANQLLQSFCKGY